MRRARQFILVAGGVEIAGGEYVAIGRQLAATVIYLLNGRGNNREFVIDSGIAPIEVQALGTLGLDRDSVSFVGCCIDG